MITPRPYLSYSQMDLVERDPKAYIEQYIYGNKRGTNRGQAFGKIMAEGLENDEATGDPVLDMVMSRIPKFEVRDKIVEDLVNGVEVEYRNQKGEIEIKKVPCIKIGKEIIPILIRPDSHKLDFSAFKEYKTGQERWTQKKVDQNVQIRFYGMGMYLITKKIPFDVELVHVETVAGEHGRIEATGEIYKYATKISQSEILNMIVRARKAWATIKTLCENELI